MSDVTRRFLASLLALTAGAAAVAVATILLLDTLG
jgi:hypothetical protein